MHYRTALAAFPAFLCLAFATPVLSAQNQQATTDRPTEVRSQPAPVTLLSSSAVNQTSSIAQNQGLPDAKTPVPAQPVTKKPVQVSSQQIQKADARVPAPESVQLPAPVAKEPTKTVFHHRYPPQSSRHISPRHVSAPALKELVVKMGGKSSTENKSPVQDHGAGFLSRVVDVTKGLVDRAISWLGTRYVWGGSSRHGVDCSGLTRLLYGPEGINLPHKARLQFQRGQIVARSGLLPGDLVFFNTRGYVSHVGIYIGENKFLHAANPRRGVRIDSLDSPYYSKRYVGARRYKDASELG